MCTATGSAIFRVVLLAVATAAYVVQDGGSLGTEAQTKMVGLSQVREGVSSEEAAQQVMDAVAAVRKTAAGDGSDSWANRVEESVMDLEAEKHEMEEKQRERHARHEKERQELRARHEKEMQALHASHSEQMKAHHESAEEAARAVMASAAEARQRAHGDGSDRFANGLEESILDLQAMDRENKRKQKERHELHEKQKQALRAQHDAEMQALHARHEEEKKALLQLVTSQSPSLSLSQSPSEDQATRAAVDDQLKQLLTVEKEETEQLKEELVVQKEESERLMDDNSAENGQPAWRFVLFLLIAAIVGFHLWQNKDSYIVHVPGVGQVKRGRWVSGAFGRDPNALPHQLSPMIPLRQMAGSEGYGGLAL